ncbi:MAG: HypC/HybG/HupF family hydrogenase formation chaperone [Nitriliruptorales bacterium]|nr:HypC/HybG/HupF family hydrogenase formation chaperone [Nitriliruptorales bacterium]
MCLGVPRRVVGWSDDHEEIALVDVNGVPNDVNVAMLKDDGVQVGDWVMVHLGFAMEIMEEDEARETLADLELLEQEFEAELQRRITDQLPGREAG